MSKLGFQKRFLLGHPCLSVAKENDLNSNLFIGRSIHFSIQFVEPHIAAKKNGHLYREFDESVRAFAAFANVPTDRNARRSSVASRLIRYWYLVEMSLLGRTEEKAWIDDATEALEWYLRASLCQVASDTPPKAVALAMEEPTEYLAWIDGSGSGGPSAELLCYMNPYWRRVAFIYGSPFDTVLSLRKEMIEPPFSKSANLKERGLHPPPAIKTQDLQI